MKRFLLILTLALAGTALSAQTVYPGMSYKEMKQVYNTRNYHKNAGDPYSVFWTGATSFFTPGLGQLIAHETGRGWAFIGGNVLTGMVASYGGQQVVKNLLRDSDGNFVKDSDGKLVATDESAAKKGAVVFLAGGLANLVLSIWSCADAVKVAKVKNMYYQDMQSRYGLEARMYPSVDLVQTGNGVQPTAGMTFALQF